MVLQAHNSLNHSQFFNVEEIMIAKYGYLMLTGASPDKEIPDIDFADEAVVQ